MSLIWMPPQTTRPPLRTAASALGTKAPTGAKMIAASSGRPIEDGRCVLSNRRWRFPRQDDTSRSRPHAHDRRRDILAQSLTEAIVLCLGGGLIGLVLVSGTIVNVGIGASAAVGIVFGYVPARQAARLHPIDAAPE